MATYLTITDLQKPAIHQAGTIVVAAVKAMRSGAPRTSAKWKTCCNPSCGPSCRDSVHELTLSVAGPVAVFLTENPSITDLEIQSSLYCDHVFECSTTRDCKLVDVNRLLRPIEEARAILTEFKWLHENLTARLIEHGAVAPLDLYDTLHGGPNDLRRQRTLPSYAVLVCALLALLVDYV
jgi:hypothetical protein